MFARSARSTLPLLSHYPLCNALWYYANAVWHWVFMLLFHPLHYFLFIPNLTYQCRIIGTVLRPAAAMTPDPLTWSHDLWVFNAAGQPSPLSIATCRKRIITQGIETHFICEFQSDYFYWKLYNYLFQFYYSFDFEIVVRVWKYVRIIGVHLQHGNLDTWIEYCIIKLTLCDCGNCSYNTTQHKW